MLTSLLVYLISWVGGVLIAVLLDIIKARTVGQAYVKTLIRVWSKAVFVHNFKMRVPDNYEFSEAGVSI